MKRIIFIEKRIQYGVVENIDTSKHGIERGNVTFTYPFTKIPVVVLTLENVKVFPEEEIKEGIENNFKEEVEEEIEEKIKRLFHSYFTGLRIEQLMALLGIYLF
jgi:hypothetical protein